MLSPDYPKAYRYRRIVAAREFIDAHYASAIDLYAMADEAFFSRFHFIRLFREAWGKTPHQYLMAVRMEQARVLLRAGSSVSDVCSAVGLESIPSFTRLFRQVTGTTPAAFARAQQALMAAQAAAPLRFVPGCYIAANGWAENSNSG